MLHPECSSFRFCDCKFNKYYFFHKIISRNNLYLCTEELNDCIIPMKSNGKTKGKVLLIATGGLANRMRAIASGYVLATECGVEFEVLWQKDKGLNANFEDIFLCDQIPFKIINTSKLYYNFYYDMPRKKNAYIPRFLHLFDKRKWFYNEIKKNLKTTEEEFRELISQNRETVIMSCFEFYPYPSQIIKQFFKPNDYVLERKNEITQGHRPSISIQIRRTDNKMSIQKSPLYLFENKIENTIKLDPQIEIFLATDDSKVKNLFHKKYSPNLLINMKKARRDTLDGIIDAVAEMFIMAESKKIYGSFYSSFAEIAAQINQAKLVILKKD